MTRSHAASVLAAAALAALALLPNRAAAQTVVKIGVINSYTGFVAQAGDLGQKGMDLYRRSTRRTCRGGQDRACPPRRHLQPRGRQAPRTGIDRARARAAALVR